MYDFNSIASAVRANQYTVASDRRDRPNADTEKLPFETILAAFINLQAPPHPQQL